MKVKKLKPYTLEVRVNYQYGEWEQRVLLLSDLHIDNPKCNRVLLIRHLEQAKVAGAPVMIFGDLFCAMQGKYDKRANKSALRPEHQVNNYLDALIKTTADFFEPYRGLIKFITPGNHDVPLWDVAARAFSPLANYQQAIGDLGVTETRVGDVALATACSARRFAWRPRGFWKDGLLDAGRVKPAAEVLGQSDARWRVMVTHHPVAVMAGLNAAEVVHGWRDVESDIERARINVILGGHLHVPYVTEITLPAGGKATYVAAGTAISTRLRHTPNSYNLLEFGEELRVERRNWTGERFMQVG
jgi:Icc-related predicted phosphoesterase